MIWWGWPPQMPYCWPVRTAKVRQSSRTGQVSQMAMASAWSSAVSEKNGSYSAVTMSRQAARLRQHRTSVMPPDRPVATPPVRHA
jgi:hypothetical protein